MRTSWLAAAWTIALQILLSSAVAWAGVVPRFAGREPSVAVPLPDPGTGLPPEKGGLCFVPSKANGKNVLVDCVSFREWSNYFYGFGTTQAERCSVVTECVPWATDWFPFEQFGMTISRSATEPFDTVGPLTSDRLYLWVISYGSPGWAAAEFGLDGTLSVREFQPAPGVLNAGTDTELLIAAACVPGILLLGEIILESPASIVPSSWGEVKAMYR